LVGAFRFLAGGEERLNLPHGVEGGVGACLEVVVLRGMASYHLLGQSVEFKTLMHHRNGGGMWIAVLPPRDLTVFDDCRADTP
jgi:hypothetical protein